MGVGKGGIQMKRTSFVRRAVAGVLSICMMFTLAAPVLAESPGAAAPAATAENVIDYGIELGGLTSTPTRVTSANCDNLAISRAVFRYDPSTNTLTGTGQIGYAFRINAPGVNVVLNGGDKITVQGRLVIVDANDVTITSDKYAAIFARDLESTINCTGLLKISSGNNMTVNGHLTVENAAGIELSANGACITNGNLSISSTGDVTLTNTEGHISHGTLTVTNAQDVTIQTADTLSDTDEAGNPVYPISHSTTAPSITASGTVTLDNTQGRKPLGPVDYHRTDGSDYVYYTSADADAESSDQLPLPEDTAYLRIEKKVVSAITVNNGTAEVGGSAASEAYNGQKVTVTAADSDPVLTRFEGWEIVSAPAGFRLDPALLQQKSFSFSMPAGAVELTAVYSYAVLVDGETIDFAKSNTTVTVLAKDRSPYYSFDHWELDCDPTALGLTAEQLQEALLTFTMPAAPVRLTSVYKAQVLVHNGTADKSYALAGDTVTVSGQNRNPGFAKFEGWRLDKGPTGFTLTDTDTEDGMSFTMPDGPVELTAVYSIPAIVMDMPVIVTNGTVNGQTGTVLLKPGQKVTVAADPAVEPLLFDHWSIEQGTYAEFELSEAQLHAEEITFFMPTGAVVLKAHYGSTVNVDNGTASADGKEGSTIQAAVGSRVDITSAMDPAVYPGMEFDHWEVVSPTGLVLDDPNSTSTFFTMPADKVELKAHWKSGPISINPDEPLDPAFGQDSDSGTSVGAVVAGVALGGAAIWGGYELTTRIILKNLLPEGAAIPANRGELAVLIWQNAGKPEPAAQPAFADVTDPDTAKAAQWCVEQGLFTVQDDTFRPGDWMPKFKTIEIWRKAF